MWNFITLSHSPALLVPPGLCITIYEALKAGPHFLPSPALGGRKQLLFFLCQVSGFQRAVICPGPLSYTMAEPGSHHGLVTLSPMLFSRLSTAWLQIFSVFLSRPAVLQVWSTCPGGFLRPLQGVCDVKVVFLITLVCYLPSSLGWYLHCWYKSNGE